MKIFILIVAFLLLIGCTKKNKIFITCSNSEIEYWGRIDSSQNKGVNLYWSGTSIKVNFEGETIKALLKDTKGDNYYNVILDKEREYIIRPDTTKKYYKLASNLSKGKHSLEIFKRTEWDRGTTTFYGFEIEKNAKILPKNTPKKRKIEFYGNSITAGYAVEDRSGKDQPDSTYTNHYKSYANITAKHFNAEFQSICKSGIGVTISWFPLTMPQLFDRLVPEDPKSKWDFSLYQPNIVVVNLFQNDSWLVNMPEKEEFKVTFGNTPPSENYLITAYQNFIRKLRDKYPTTKIICMLGNMDATKKESLWPSYINKAVIALNDKNIYTHFVPYKETPNHPTIEEQKKIADSLIDFIDKNIIW